MNNPLPICYEDTHLIAINKPTGLLVHRTTISEDQTFVLQLLRDQIGQRIYPIHRLDRATTGVLVFGKTPEVTAHLSEQMRSRTIRKEYLAIIRGYVPEEDIIDYPLINKPHLPPQQAITHYNRIDQTEMPFSVNRYPTSRYSLIRIRPQSGRRHQIRRHFAHIRHPIIGDKKHGDCKHNKFFKLNYNLPQMMLHASSLTCINPFTKQKLNISAPIPTHFESLLNILQLKLA